MALQKLDNALFIARTGCFVTCCLALVMYIGNGHMTLNTAIRSSLAALALQITVSLTVLGVATTLPNHLGLSLLIILAEGLTAFVMMATGWAIIGIVEHKFHDEGSCFTACKVSLVYALLMWIGGGLGIIAVLCNTVVAAKMNIEREFQD